MLSVAVVSSVLNRLCRKRRAQLLEMDGAFQCCLFTEPALEQCQCWTIGGIHMLRRRGHRALECVGPLPDAIAAIHREMCEQSDERPTDCTPGDVSRIEVRDRNAMQRSDQRIELRAK